MSITRAVNDELEIYLPPGLINYIIDFIDVSNHPVVHKLDCIENFAPDRHPLLSLYSTYVIRCRQFIKEIRICPKCRKYGIFDRSHVNCISCLFNPERIGILAETPIKIKRKIERKALNHFLDHQINHIFTESQSQIITKKRTFSVSYLILSATKSGKQQNQNEIIRHHPNNNNFFV